MPSASACSSPSSTTRAARAPPRPRWPRTTSACRRNGHGDRLGLGRVPLVPFDSLYRHGFARVAAGVPHLRPAEPKFNVERTLGLAQRAADEQAVLVVFPELGLSAYAIDDLLHQDALNDGVEDALRQVIEASADL